MMSIFKVNWAPYQHSSSISSLITCWWGKINYISTGFCAVLQKAEEEVGNLSDPKRRGVEHPPPPAPPKEGGGVMGGFGHPSTSPTIVTSTTIGRVICFLQLRNRGKHWTQECTMHAEVSLSCRVFSRCTCMDCICTTKWLAQIHAADEYRSLPT